MRGSDGGGRWRAAGGGEVKGERKGKEGKGGGVRGGSWPTYEPRHEAEPMSN